MPLSLMLTSLPQLSSPKKASTTQWLSLCLAEPRRSSGFAPSLDRKSTRLNYSHTVISYAVFCLKKKKTKALHHLRGRRRIGDRTPQRARVRRAGGRYVPGGLGDSSRHEQRVGTWSRT